MKSQHQLTKEHEFEQLMDSRQKELCSEDLYHLAPPGRPCESAAVPARDSFYDPFVFRHEGLESNPWGFCFGIHDSGFPPLQPETYDALHHQPAGCDLSGLPSVLGITRGFADFGQSHKESRAMVTGVNEEAFVNRELNKFFSTGMVEEVMKSSFANTVTAEGNDNTPSSCSHDADTSCPCGTCSIERENSWESGATNMNHFACGSRVKRSKTEGRGQVRKTKSAKRLRKRVKETRDNAELTDVKLNMINQFFAKLEGNEKGTGLSSVTTDENKENDNGLALYSKVLAISHYLMLQQEISDLVSGNKFVENLTNHALLSAKDLKLNGYSRSTMKRTSKRTSASMDVDSQETKAKKLNLDTSSRLNEGTRPHYRRPSDLSDITSVKQEARLVVL